MGTRLTRSSWVKLMKAFFLPEIFFYADGQKAVGKQL